MSTDPIPLSRRALLKTVGLGASAWALTQASPASGEGMKKVGMAEGSRRMSLSVS